MSRSVAGEFKLKEEGLVVEKTLGESSGRGDKKPFSEVPLEVR